MSENWESVGWNCFGKLEKVPRILALSGPITRLGVKPAFRKRNKGSRLQVLLCSREAHIFHSVMNSTPANILGMDTGEETSTNQFVKLAILVLTVVALLLQPPGSHSHKLRSRLKYTSVRDVAT